MKIKIVSSFILLALVFQFILGNVQSASIAPTWASCGLMQANTTVIKSNPSTNLSANSSLTASSTFARAFAVAPHVAYGIRTYRCKFEVNFSD